jgi:hypothetical protein
MCATFAVIRDATNTHVDMKPTFHIAAALRTSRFMRDARLRAPMHDALPTGARPEGFDTLD